MPDVVPAGSYVSAGTYRCTNCGYQLDIELRTLLPPCPICGGIEWEAASGRLEDEP